MAPWRSLALARLIVEIYYTADVIASACVDVIYFFNHCALAFTGFGPFEYKNTIL